MVERHVPVAVQRACRDPIVAFQDTGLHILLKHFPDAFEPLLVETADAEEGGPGGLVRRKPAAATEASEGVVEQEETGGPQV
ncbi:MAG: hypothetical protein R3C45_22285 [Phycisphaerales bacterium]